MGYTNSHERDRRDGVVKGMLIMRSIPLPRARLDHPSIVNRWVGGGVKLIMNGRISSCQRRTHLCKDMTVQK